MSTKPGMPAPEESDFGPNSLNAENFVVTGGVIDTTVRPMPEAYRKNIEKHRPWLLKPPNEQGPSDQPPNGNDGTNEPPMGNGQ